MPLVKFIRPVLVGTRTVSAGHVDSFDPRQADHYVNCGAGVIVPPGYTPDADAGDSEPETASADRSPERATHRRGR